jgi:hypothetical protein
MSHSPIRMSHPQSATVRHPEAITDRPAAPSRDPALRTFQGFETLDVSRPGNTSLGSPVKPLGHETPPPEILCHRIAIADRNRYMLAVRRNPRLKRVSWINKYLSDQWGVRRSGERGTRRRMNSTKPGYGGKFPDVQL